MVKLIVHIGHGKTGSTSIQQSLLCAESILAQQGVKYLGLMLEHAQAGAKHGWQFRAGSDVFFDMTPPAEANAQIMSTIENELIFLQSIGVTRAIWSNEWLLTRSQSVMSALVALKDRGYDIEVQCYIRRHDKWAQSAYAQWGMKHKSYNGPVRNFTDWLPVFGDSQFRFYPSLSIWDKAFGNALKVFNFDLAGDVVQHFLRVNGISGVDSVQENKTPGPVVVASQAVFNSRSQGQVLPEVFDPILDLVKRTDENGVTLPPIDRLNPSLDILQSLVEARKDDIFQVNALLERSGEPKLSFATAPQHTPHPTPWEVDQFLLKLVFALSEELGQLKLQVGALQDLLQVSDRDRVL